MDHGNTNIKMLNTGRAVILESPMSPQGVEEAAKKPRDYAAEQRNERLLLIASIAFGAIGIAAIIVFLGAVYVLTGHVILCATVNDGYEAPLQGALQSGAVGAIIISPVAAWVYFVIRACWEGDRNSPLPPLEPANYTLCETMCIGSFKKIVELSQNAALGAAASGIGGVVLHLHGHDVMDSVHAARAGALGGVILWPAIQVAVLVGGIVVIALIKALPCEISYWNDRTVQTWG